MKQLVLDQLKKCVWADTAPFIAGAVSGVIPHYSKPRYAVNHSYLIKVDKEVINNPNTIAATNFNQGRAPRAEYYKIFVNKTMGHMIQVDALVFDWVTHQDTSDYWSGWLDVDTLTQISVL